MRKNIHIFVIFLILLFFFSCEKKNDNIVDPSFDSPLIYSVNKSTDTVSTISGTPVINLNVSAVVGKNNGSEIKIVICKVLDPLSNTLGNFNLGKTGDSTYSGTINITNISCLLVGNYSLIFSAENEIGLSSNQITSTLYVKNTANVSPVIISTNLPDSVVRPISGSVPLTISINVTDADGHCDIKDVYFGAYRPNGNFIGFNPLVFSSNNEWTFTNVVTPSTADSSYGYFRYQFFARDRSDAISSGVWDSIKFVRP